MSERIEELPTEVLQADETLARVYRMSETFQVFLYVILSFAGIALLYKFSEPFGNIALLTIIGLFYLAILYPIIVKIQNVRRYAIGMGLRFSTVGGVIVLIGSEYRPSTDVSRGLFIAALLILIFELYQHLIGIYPKRRAYLRSIIGVSSIIFAISMYVVFADVLSPMMAIIGTFIMTLLFIRAILPERKI